MKSIKINPSKSYTQRAILYALFSGIKTWISNTTPLCNDSKATLELAKLLTNNGVDINGDNIIINPSDLIFPSEINVNESGTLCRMLIPLLITQNGKITINGNGSLLNRNLSLSERMDNIFSFLYDINIKTNNGHLPISIDCTNKKDYIDSFKYYSFDGSDTSQYISGFIMALSILNFGDITIDIANCYSMSYILMTVDTIQKFGVDIKVSEITNTSCRIFLNKNDKPLPLAISYNIEGDWSGAAGIMIYNILINPLEEYEYINLKYDSIQSDRKILNLLNNFCTIKYKDKNIFIKRNSSFISPFEFDCTYSPDLFPVVCALAATISSGYSKIKGLSRLTNKESNRGMVIFEEFKKYGINVEIEDDYIKIKGISDEINDVEYNSYNDHRIAMALIILRKFYGLSVPEEDICLNKSYNTFLQDTVYAK